MAKKKPVNLGTHNCQLSIHQFEQEGEIVVSLQFKVNPELAQTFERLVPILKKASLAFGAGGADGPR